MSLVGFSHWRRPTSIDDYLDTVGVTVTIVINAPLKAAVVNSNCSVSVAVAL